MQSEEGLLAENERIPNKMKRHYDLFITYKERKPTMVKSISQLNSSMIGALTILKGIVIRAD